MSNFDPALLLGRNEIRNSINSNKSYFSLISALYYIKNNEKYKEERVLIEETVKEKLLPINEDISVYSELCHLFLDIICCPHVSLETRRELIKSYLYHFEPSETGRNIDRIIESISETYWFVKWNDLNLIKLIERKELIPAY